MTVKEIPYRDILEVSEKELHKIASSREGNFNVSRDNRHRSTTLSKINTKQRGSFLRSRSSSEKVVETYPSISYMEPDDPVYGVASCDESYEQDAKRVAKVLDNEFDDVDIILSQKL